MLDCLLCPSNPYKRPAARSPDRSGGRARERVYSYSYIILIINLLYSREDCLAILALALSLSSVPRLAFGPDRPGPAISRISPLQSMIACVYTQLRVLPLLTRRYKACIKQCGFALYFAHLIALSGFYAFIGRNPVCLRPCARTACVSAGLIA